MELEDYKNMTAGNLYSNPNVIFTWQDTVGISTESKVFLAGLLMPAEKQIAGSQWSANFLPQIKIMKKCVNT